ncbi:hypothetical protein IKQ21_01655 [bacterium]|nr:hypothetical protein [bacterium]
MRILPVTYTNNTNLTKNNTNISTNFNPSPSFRSFEPAGLFGRLLMLNGIGKIINNKQHLKLKRNLMEDYIKSVKNIDLEQHIPVNLLFKLSKTFADKEPNGLFDMYYVLNDKFPFIGDIRDCALRDIFPLIKEMPNDANRGHEAKVSMLESMIETGEYIKSVYFYKAFCNLPQNYDKNKVVMLEKMMNNPFYMQNYINYCNKHGDKDATSKIYSTDYLLSLINVAITLLSSTLSKVKNAEFFMVHKDKLKKCNEVADSIAAGHLINKDYPDYFYHIYAEGLTNGANSVFTQAYIDKFYLDKISKLKDNKKEGMKFFGISGKYFDDIVKDFNTLTEASECNEGFWDIINKRVNEKLHSDDENIKKSAIGFLDMSGLGKEFLDTQKADAQLKEKLEARIKEAPDMLYRYGHNGNYRYDDEFSYLDIKKQIETMNEIHDREETAKEWRSTISEHMWGAANGI